MAKQFLLSPAVEEFLGARSTTLTMHNAVDGDVGQRLHESFGKPTIPSVLVDGDPVPIFHPVQLRSLLGMPAEDGDGPEPWLPLAWDIASILDDWLRLLPVFTWEQLLAPTLSRGRNTRNLTVNVWRPIELLPVAYERHFFGWYTGEADLQVEAYLHTVEQVADYAQRGSWAWQSWLMELTELPEVDDPWLSSTRGDTAFSHLLRAQRFHAAFHHRQITDFLTTQGVAFDRQLDVTALPGIGLPDEIY